MIKFLLYKGITIAELKDMLNKNIYKLDDNGDHGLKLNIIKVIQLKVNNLRKN